MSADNWAICPKCVEKQSSWKQVMGEPLTNSDHTLREDYEQGIDPKGNYYVCYGCSCSVCGFRWSYKHEVNVLKEFREAVK